MSTKYALLTSYTLPSFVHLKKFSWLSSQNFTVKWMGKNFQITDVKTQKSYRTYPRLCKKQTLELRFPASSKAGPHEGYFVCLHTDTRCNCSFFPEIERLQKSAYEWSFLKPCKATLQGYGFMGCKAVSPKAIEKLFSSKYNHFLKNCEQSSAPKSLDFPTSTNSSAITRVLLRHPALPRIILPTRIMLGFFQFYWAVIDHRSLRHTVW